MKRIFVLLLVLSGTFYSGFAQKQKEDKFEINKKDQTFYFGTQPLFKFVELKTNPGYPNYYFTTLEGEKLLLLSLKSFNSLKKVSKSNPNGKVTYYEITFLTDDKPSCEISYRALKSIGKTIYERGLIKEGKLNIEEIELFVIENGTRYSDERDGGI